MTKSSSSSNNRVKLNGKQAQELLEILGQLDVQKVIDDGVNMYIGTGTRMLLELLMHAEVQQLCGDWYKRGKDRQALRWGNEQGRAVYQGARQTVTRPRVVRNLDGRKAEVPLTSYSAMNRDELIDGPLTAAILAGVSKRRYASLLSRAIEARGVSKSNISRRAISSTKPMVEEFRRRRLDNLDLIAILFDGIHIAKKQMIACIGVDINGIKHVLGLRVGATENEIVCRDLIRDLVERGVDQEKKYLFVVDGSKALTAAIRAAFGQNVAIQRCQEHKIRDVQAYLPVKLRNEVREKMQAAFNQGTEKAAFKRLAELRSELLPISENAANALVEGQYETLTVLRLKLTGHLKASLRTTNIMESAFSSVRRYVGRVTSFQHEEQIEIWVTRAILEAERHFRRLKGHRQLRSLRKKLEGGKR